jgi:hypothetical protein
LGGGELNPYITYRSGGVVDLAFELAESSRPTSFEHTLNV